VTSRQSLILMGPRNSPFLFRPRFSWGELRPPDPPIAIHSAAFSRLTGCDDDSPHSRAAFFRTAKIALPCSRLRPLKNVLVLWPRSGRNHDHIGILAIGSVLGFSLTLCGQWLIHRMFK
jgi:hypothetical protein